MNREDFILKKNMLNAFLEKLFAFPLWVRQIIFLRLYQNLSLYLSEDFLSIQERDIFHLYVPVLSFMGRTELFEQKARHDDTIYTFLKYVEDGLSMLEIAMNNFLTMEEVAKTYMDCLELNYVKTPDSVHVLAMAGFMGGKYRTGEYFKRVGRINVDQLESVIVAQRKAISEGNKLKIAEIMISMGFVTEKDTSSLLLIKEESKQRFMLDLSIVPKELDNEIKRHYEAEVAKLKDENKELKEKLTKVLALLKKNA